MATVKQAVKRADLTPQQAEAAALVAVGKTPAEVAEAVGVDPSVVTTWTDRPAFVAQANRHRRAIWTAAHDRLRALVPDALTALEQAVKGGDVKAAMEVLKACDLYGNVAPPRGAVDPEQVMAKDAKDWAESEAEKRQVADARYVSSGEKETMAQQRLRELRAAG